MARTSKRTTARIAALLCVVGTVSIAYRLALPPLLMSLKPKIEQRFARTALEDGDEIAGFVVPGGGDERIREGLELAQRFPKTRLILTGARYDEIALLKEVPDPTGRFSVETQAGNTYENAVFSKHVAQPKAGERWILVTTTLHMPRAIGVFAAAGFPVEPWPVPMRPLPRRYVEPMVGYEVAALAFYRLTGRTPAFLPGPADVGLHIGDPQQATLNMHKAAQ